MAVLGMLPILIQFLSFLPPANKVWGEVIFSEACVKNSVHRGVGGVPDQVPPLGPGRYTPPGPGRYPPGTRQVHPPRTRKVPPWTMQVPPGTRQVHPPGPGRYTPPGPGRYNPLGPGRSTPPEPGRYSPPPLDQAGTPPPGPGRYTPPPRYGQRTGGMHPTGMQSCYAVFCKTRAKYEMTIKSRNAIQNKIEKE